MPNTEIGCSVKSCRYNDKVNYCTLNSIHVGKTKAMGECKDKCDTECDSFMSEA